MNSFLLLAAAAIALAWANSPWAGAYFQLAHAATFAVNDVLMVPFFFAAGIEIRRELQGGSLAGWRCAAFPALLALGGMATPALLYLAIAGGAPTRAGWGVPVATDIAFALAALGVLGRRVPPALRVLLLAVAVIDDLGATAVIALFYAPPGAAVGIHPAIAGAILGLLTPARLQTPLLRRLEPWIGRAIMPLFAFVNAGVTVAAIAGASLPLTAAVVTGLVVGKPLGIVAAAKAAQYLRLGALPDALTRRHLLVLGAFAGIGFTMSLFIAPLAFVEPELLAAAKLGVLLASAAAAGLGIALGRLLLAPPADFL